MSERLASTSEAGVVKTKRRLKDRTPYLHLVPRPRGSNVTVKHNANVYDTVDFIPLIVKGTLHQTEQLARVLIGKDLKETCANIWKWIYDHIEFEKDESFLEQVRAPSRLVYDGKGDCDCYTTTIDSLLENVRRITKWTFTIVNRITKYGGWNFQHIYPYVITPNGERIIIDCVTEKFNYEEPYTEKKDFLMDLQLLNGIDRYALEENDFSGLDEVDQEDLGKLKDVFHKAGTGIKTAVKKTGKAVMKAAHVVNKVNPASVATRGAVLLAMKTNFLNIAGRLKWTYLTQDQAKQKGLVPQVYTHRRTLRERLEKIFFGAGGDPKNFRQAILTGRGNKGKNQEVSGLGVIPIYAMRDEGIGAREILGEEMYKREGLGLPFVMPAAVTSALAAIAAALKKLGPIKAGEKSESDDPDTASDTVSSADAPPSDPGANARGDGTDGSGEGGDEIKFSDDPKGWIKANPGKSVGIALLACAAGLGIYKVATKKKQEVPPPLPTYTPSKQLAGLEQKFYPVALPD